MKKCPSRSLTPYLDGELAPDARTQVEEHLQTCASCGALLDEVTSARERVRSMGRAIIPDTVLMPALEIFREKGGIGQGRQLDFSQVPTPASAEAVAVMDEDAATDTPESEVDEDERYNAVLDAQPAVAAVLPEAPATEVPSARTWVNVAPLEATADPDAVLESEAPPEPEPAVAVESVLGTETAAPFGPADFAEEEPSAAARWLGSDFDETISPEAMYALEAGAALDARPEPPAPQQVPPWLDAEEADTEDIEAHGRRVIEESLEAERIQATGAAWDVPAAPASVEAVEAGEAGEAVEAGDAAPEPVVDPVDEVATPEPVAGIEAEPSWPHPPAPLETVAAGTSEPPADSSVDDYRDSLRTRTEPRRGAAGLDSLDTQVKIGLGVAATIVLLLAAIFGLPRLFTHSTRPVATIATSRPTASTPSPGNQATPVPSPQVSAPALVPALTGVLPAGKGGTGYKVYRVRALNPKPGLYLIAFDLQGSGPLPDVQLGEAADHSLYLQSAGTTIDPALASAFPGAGPVTAMSPTGAAATSLKLTTSTAAHFFIYYLTGPPRLVIQLS